MHPGECRSRESPRESTNNRKESTATQCYGSEDPEQPLKRDLPCHKLSDHFRCQQAGYLYVKLWYSGCSAKCLPHPFRVKMQVGNHSYPKLYPFYCWQPGAAHQVGTPGSHSLPGHRLALRTGSILLLIYPTCLSLPKCRQHQGELNGLLTWADCFKALKGKVTASLCSPTNYEPPHFPLSPGAAVWMRPIPTQSTPACLKSVESWSRCRSDPAHLKHRTED